MSSGDQKAVERAIASLEGTRKRVHATELYTLALLPRLRRRAERAVAFYDQVLGSLAHVADTAELRELMTGTAGSGRVLHVVITSSRGMCGPYNRHVLDELDRSVADLGGLASSDVEHVVLGAKGRTHLERAGARVVLAVDKGLEEITLEEMSELATWVLGRTRTGEYREVRVVYTRYLDALHTRATTLRLLPLDPPETGPGDGSILDFDGDAAALVDRLIEDYAAGMLYSLLRYSVAAEYSERRLAMQQAMRGIDDELAAARVRRKQAVVQKQTDALLEIVNNRTPGERRRRRKL